MAREVCPRCGKLRNMEVYATYDYARRKNDNIGYIIPPDEKSPMELLMAMTLLAIVLALTM